MTNVQTPAVRAEATRIDGLDEALAQMKALGVTEGHRAGYTQGRIDAGAILTADAAKGREGFAAKLAADPDIKPEKAMALLTDVPVAKSGESALDKLMQARDPKIGTSSPQPEDGRSARSADLQAAAKAANTLRR